MFSEGLAAVEIGYKKWGFIDKKGNLVIPAIYEYVRDFSNGFAGVGINVELIGIVGDYGFINTKGKIIVPLIYELIEKDFYFDDNSYLTAVVHNKRGDKVWVDENGKPTMWIN